MKTSHVLSLAASVYGAAALVCINEASVSAKICLVLTAVSIGILLLGENNQ